MHGALRACKDCHIVPDIRLCRVEKKGVKHHYSPNQSYCEKVVHWGSDQVISLTSPDQVKPLSIRL